MVKEEVKGMYWEVYHWEVYYSCRNRLTPMELFRFALIMQNYQFMGHPWWSCG